MAHYICTGECGRKSDTEGACKAEYCTHFHKPLEKCMCTDGKHADLLNGKRHFVCVGTCGGVAPEAGLCKAEDCVRASQPLVPCACTDGKHEEVMKIKEDGKIEEYKPELKSGKEGN